LFTGPAGDSIGIRMQTSRSMLNSIIVFGQGLDPTTQNAFRTFEGHQPFEAMMISPKDDFGSKEIMSEALQGDHNG